MTTVNAHLVWPLLVRPTLSTIHKKDAAVARMLTIALGNAENTDPGFLHELVNALYNQMEESSSSPAVDPLNMTESLLRAQGRLSGDDLKMTIVNPQVQTLVERTTTLKKLLSRVPDEVQQRTAFLQTIKEIASAIKKILDSLDALIAELPTVEKRIVEQRKRQLVKNSKQFSQALKCHFKGSFEVNDLFSTAAQLIYDAHLIEKVCNRPK